MLARSGEHFGAVFGEKSLVRRHDVLAGGERVEHVLKRRFGSAKHLNNDRNLRVIDDAIGIGDDFTGIKRIIT